jgi:hypothetical protein
MSNNYKHVYGAKKVSSSNCVRKRSGYVRIQVPILCMKKAYGFEGKPHYYVQSYSPTKIIIDKTSECFVESTV